MRPESILQRRVKRLLENMGYRVVASANGAVLAGNPKQRAIQMNSLKSMGLTPGFPDLLVYGPDGKMGHIEIKIEGQHATDAQMEVEDWLTGWGHKFAVCRSLADVAETLCEWGWE